MKNRTAFEILIEEHRLIKKFLAVLGSMLDQIDQGNKPALDDLRTVVLFSEEFADQFHHAKEETILFGELEKLKIKDEADQIGSLKMEHFLNRSFCSSMAEALDLMATKQPDGWEAFTENARAYLALLLHHVCKEDHQFFPWCQEQLSSEMTEKLLQQFKKTAEADFEPQFNQNWIDKISRLKDMYGESAEVIAACD